MTASQFLQVVDVATPCHSEWNSMTGDERSRFCGQCRKHVYNLSAMSADLAVALIREKEGDLCIRLYRRTDGTVLTGDCPVGVGSVWRRIKALAAGVLAAGTLAIGSQIWPGVITHTAAANDQVAAAGAPGFRQRWRDLIDDVKAWLGIAPPTRIAVMGDFVMGGCEPNPAWSDGLGELNRLYQLEVQGLPPPPPQAEPASEF